MNLRVDRWCSGQWEPVLNFDLNQEEPANEFALKLSMTKRYPIELAVFEDGKKLDGPILEPLFVTAAGNGVRISESSP